MDFRSRDPARFPRYSDRSREEVEKPAASGFPQTFVAALSQLPLETGERNARAKAHIRKRAQKWKTAPASVRSGGGLPLGFAHPSVDLTGQGRKRERGGELSPWNSSQIPKREAKSLDGSRPHASSHSLRLSVPQDVKCVPSAVPTKARANLSMQATAEVNGSAPRAGAIFRFGNRFRNIATRLARKAGSRPPRSHILLS
jgi:hypothetical protein